MIDATVSAPSEEICGNADIDVSKMLESFVDVTKCSIKLYPKIGSSTDSLVIKNGTFIFSGLSFYAKSIKATLSILKLVLFVVVKFVSETRSNCSDERVDTTGNISLNHFFYNRLTIDPVSLCIVQTTIYKRSFSNNFH